MNRTLLFFSVAIFSVFIGSQVTEACLLVPYWKSMSTSEFYEYYAKFGPSIGKFFTVLTLIAALIPLSFSIYCFIKESPALKYAILSTLFAFLFIALFYVYFKNANQQFYDQAFNSNQLQSELETWANWHWFRILIEVLSLTFLIFASAALSRAASQVKTLDEYS